VDTVDFTTSQWLFGGEGLGYPYWHSLDKWRGHDVIFVDDDDKNIEARLGPHFREVEVVADERLLALGGKRYRLAIGRDLH
jgi:hypothetical protein